MGNLTVLSFHSFGDRGRALWNCKCTCGNICVKRSYWILKGISTHCGCVKRIPYNKRHNESHGPNGRTKEYRAWSGMRNRCNSVKCKKYSIYGGRGIKVCDRWESSYDNFLSDMGRAPSPKHSLDRINVNGNYEPSNCRWATSIEQSNNTRINRVIEFNGSKMTLKQWCRFLGIDYAKTYPRIKYLGWSIDDAFRI